MKLFVALCSFIFFCLFVSQQTFAQSNGQAITPTLYCLGGVPCNAAATQTEKRTTSSPVDNKTIHPAAEQPCDSTQSTVLGASVRNEMQTTSSGSQGFFKAFFELLLKLIELILQKYSGQTPSTPTTDPSVTATPTPCPQPTTISVQPTSPSLNLVKPTTASNAGNTNDVKAATCGGSASTPIGSVTGYKISKCEDFNGSSMPSGWTAYNGGGGDTVVGKGRVASQCAVGNGVLTQTQNADGATCGMSSNFGQKYGYWEIKMRTYSTGSGGSAPHPVLILWPDSNAWSDGELDYVETNIGKAGIDVYLHCVGNPSKNCYNSSHNVDITQWHVYGFEWTSAGLKGFIDGKEIYSTDGKGSNPKTAMHQTIQLDNLTGKSPAAPGKMEVDWVHMYNK